MQKEKILTVQQVKRALLMFYGKGQNYNYVKATVDSCVEHDWLNMLNVCPAGNSITGEVYGTFSFKYIGNKLFECQSDFPELLTVK